MMFNWRTAFFVLFIVIAACAFVPAAAFACVERFKTSIIAAIIMAISAMVAAGIGGAL